MKINNLEINKDIPLYMAPMAGVTDKTYRSIVRDFGADITCTEMVSAKALAYKNKNAYSLIEFCDNENIKVIQIFGSDKDIMAAEAIKLQDACDMIDINMGCPVQKIVSNGEGSALMKNPALASEIVKKLSSELEIPLTVKMRIGYDEKSINGVDFAKMLEDSGAAAITVHGRTRSQLYSGKADYGTIKRIKDSVSIPVFGNGDVFTAQDAIRMRDETGVDGIAIARGAEGNPWIFREVRAALDGREVPARPSMEEIREVAIRHARGLIEDKGDYIGIREMRKHLSWYTSGIKGSAAFRGRINYIETYDEMLKEIDNLFC